ncbi:MAG: hypothetical protein SF051_01120 [Elusimicrobiota bacterium]|nr:hypothetical protein [Elusimicrobiota bacterium]
MNAAALAVLLAIPARAADPPFRVAVIEDEPTVMTAMLAQPLERVLRESPGASLSGAENVPCEFGGADFRFILPGSLGAPATEDASAAAALETDAEVAVVYPPLPSLVAALTKAAADPRTFRRPGSLRLQEREAEAARAVLPSGEVALNVRARLARRPTMRRRMSMAVYYRLTWEGRDAAVLVVGRTFGGLGRLGTAAAREAARGPFLGVSRGGAFGRASSDAQGRAALDALERAGLRLSAVDASMAERWNELEAYRRERPDGVRFLSANLTRGDAPVLPAYEVVASSGLRVAFIGLTAPSAAAALREAAGAGWAVGDPVAAVESRIAELREKADVVVALGDLSSSDLARLSQAMRGLDLVIGDDDAYLTVGPAPQSVLEQDDRPGFANAFPPVRLHSPALDVLSVTRVPDDDHFDWRVVHEATTLDDSLNPSEGYPEPGLDSFAVRSASGAALLPPARAVFPAAARPGGIPAYEARDVWTVAAAALAERARSEAALLPVSPLGVQTVGEVREPYLREWLGRGGPVSVVTVSGARLRQLADSASDQVRREAEGRPIAGPLRFVLSGVDAKGRVRGAPLDASARYRLAVANRAADLLGLGGPGDPVPGSPTAADAALEELRRRAGSPPEAYRSWMTGEPLSAPGLWRVNFRDVGLNLRQTRVVRSDEFDAVPNSRVQGFNELLVGGVFKTDVDYLKGEYKWTNTVEAEYAKSRIEPRRGPATTNLAANRLMLLTLGTRRAGGIPYAWLARSWGPSLGLQYDGEFAAAPGLRRKNIYSAFPGVELFDGSVVNSFILAGIVKRDLSRDPPDTQSGARLRTLFSAPIGPGTATLQGEVWNNYFFLTKRDSPTDLRMEGDANVKLIVPVYKHLSVSPYLDFYWFQLKTRPDWGYSFMMGVTIGFSRLWKPQYEPF